MRATGVICNDDFTDHLTDIRHLCLTLEPLLWAAQESKQTNYRALLGERWGVRQRQSNEATQGVAVGWDRRRARAIGDAVDNPHDLGHGWLPMAEGGSTLIRGVVWQDLYIPGARWVKRLREASVHRHPLRDKAQWPEFDHNLTAWIKASPIPVKVDMDSNEEGGPHPLIKATGLHWHGHRIDGSLTNLRFVRTRDLPYRHSDHRPLEQRFWL